MKALKIANLFGKAAHDKAQKGKEKPEAEEAAEIDGNKKKKPGVGMKQMKDKLAEIDE